MQRARHYLLKFQSWIRGVVWALFGGWLLLSDLKAVRPEDAVSEATKAFDDLVKAFGGLAETMNRAATLLQELYDHAGLDQDYNMRIKEILDSCGTVEPDQK